MATSVYVHVALKDDPNLALVQTGLRNAGFDQKLYVEELNRMEGTIGKEQVNNLLLVPDVDAVKVIREVL